MNLKEELLRGIYAYGFEKPSAIQQRAILPCVKGHDVIAQAQSGNLHFRLKYFAKKNSTTQLHRFLTTILIISGTGKTATFSISILQQIDTNLNECQALILAPTRELAQQVRVLLFIFIFINIVKTLYLCFQLIALFRFLSNYLCFYF